MKYALQSRWVLKDNKLQYYGLRNKENLFKNSVKLNKKQIAIIETLPKDLSGEEKIILKNLIGVQIVEEKDVRKIPTSLKEARFCKSCVANDFIIAGLEFNDEGLCPMCQTADETKNLKAVLPVIKDIPRSKKSRFDIAVFYTGGKDSTYLLYYLSVVKNLRVLALTWEIPFMSETARRSIENAKKRLNNVEFISRRILDFDLKLIYKKLYELGGNTCACPSLAYALFYPELVANKVPCFAVGNEPVQMLGLYYNKMAPKLAYRFSNVKALNFLINLGRVLTLRPPLKSGQFQTLMTMRKLVKGKNRLQKLVGYENELVDNVVEAIHEVPKILTPLKKSVMTSSWSGNIPRFIHIDFDEVYGGKYNWDKVKDILVNECGWVQPKESEKALHTSCQIEKCKDYSQFIRFYKCESTTIPFSAIEISLASRNCGRTLEENIKEIENELGFSLEEIKECEIMKEFLK